MKRSMGSWLLMLLAVAAFACGSPATDDADGVGGDVSGDGACVPECEGRVCGSDGCGGSCGACEGDEICNASGLCSAGCAPKCEGLVCGDDGCGGSCGTCAADQTCAAGQCEGGCVPACDGKACGPDGCGGDCGLCTVGQSCDAQGQCQDDCVPDCDGKECGIDGCGGSCGGCPMGQTCNIAGLCEGGCAPACDGKACGDDGCGGSCGACPAGEACTATGKCEACAPACDGKVCGSDGCGGTCGACGPDEICDATGQCVGGGDPCQGVTMEGCCDGDNVRWCEDGVLYEVPCPEAYANGRAEGELCGWIEAAGYYWCDPLGQAEPTGAQPKACQGCVPSCDGKECGSDGCSGSCGACGDGETCTAAGLCIDCAPACDGKACGADGCGGACGACGADEWCDADGQCQTECEPACDGKECGDDGCGGSCGDCPMDTGCNADGICEGCAPMCDGKECGPDGCDALCGVCAEGEACTADGLCEACAPMCDDKACGDDGCGGSCGACGLDETCEAGACVYDPCGGIPWEGCCAGDVLKYCDGDELTTLDCADGFGGYVCGWYAGDGVDDSWYTCGPESVLDATGDPSGAFPLACPAECEPQCDGKVCGPDGCGGSCGTCDVGGCTDDGQCVDACDGLTYEGCCVGDTLRYCLEGVVEEMGCNTPDNPDSICGWFAGSDAYAMGYYCGAEQDPDGQPLLDPAGDPSGAFPLACEGACVPVCDGKVCGDDGCGGVCGACGPGQTCSVDGAACEGVCQPACEGKVCGDDGCGGVCGTCDEGADCIEGACHAPCDHEGFEVEGDVSAYDVEPQLLVYSAYQPTEARANYLSLELWGRLGAPTTPGTYEITDAGYDTCATCVLVVTECDDQGCERMFLAQAGELVLTQVGVVGDTLAGELHDVAMVEVDFDPDTWATTPIPDGESWCVDTLSFDKPIQPW